MNILSILIRSFTSLTPFISAHIYKVELHARKLEKCSHSESKDFHTGGYKPSEIRSRNLENVQINKMFSKRGSTVFFISLHMFPLFKQTVTTLFVVYERGHISTLTEEDA